MMHCSVALLEQTGRAGESLSCVAKIGSAEWEPCGTATKLLSTDVRREARAGATDGYSSSMAVREGIASKSVAPGRHRKAGPRWYAAATKPGQELIAARHLERQGFESFSPSLVKTVCHARRRMERRVALFPGYLFVRFDIENCAWRSVNGTLGIRSLVMAGDRPLPAPYGLVEGFIELSDKSGLMQTELQSGQRVEILSGPFANLVGTVERLDAKGRAHVLLHLLNGECAVAMDRATLWPAA